MPLLESCSSRDNDEEQIVVADSRLDSRVFLSVAVPLKKIFERIFSDRSNGNSILVKRRGTS